MEALKKKGVDVPVSPARKAFGRFSVNGVEYETKLHPRSNEFG